MLNISHKYIYVNSIHKKDDIKSYCRCKKKGYFDNFNFFVLFQNNYLLFVYSLIRMTWTYIFVIRYLMHYRIAGYVPFLSALYFKIHYISQRTIWKIGNNICVIFYSIGKIFLYGLLKEIGPDILMGKSCDISTIL